MEEEINVKDLLKYIEIPIRQWQLIISITLICAIVAGLASIATPKIYEANVLIASTKVESNVSFGLRIQTISEDQLLAFPGAYNLFDWKARQQSYIQMIKNPIIAQVVLNKLQDQLKDPELTVTDLINKVQGKEAGTSDSIEIVVRYKDPVLAAAIANAWGEAFVDQVNTVYSKSGSGESYTAIKSQSTDAKTSYDTAQAALVDFITNNQIDQLTREISQSQTIITSLSDARNTAVNTIISEQTKAQLQVIQEYYKTQTQNQLLALQRDQEGRRQLITAYINALISMRQSAFNEQVQNLQTKLTNTYSELRRVESLMESAKDMRRQVEVGGVGAAISNSLALTLLKAQVFAANAGLGDNLQVQTTSTYIDAPSMMVDLDGLISTLETKKKTLNEQIDTLSEQLMNNQGLEYLDIPLDNAGELAAAIEKRYPELFQAGQLADLSLNVVDEGNPLADEAQTRVQDLLELKGSEGLLNFDVGNTPIQQKIVELDQKVRDLRAQLTIENDKKQELTRARDLAWDTYKTIATKETELGVAAQTKGTEVALSAPAAVPEKDIVSGSRSVAFAMLVGLLLGIIAAYAIEFWWWYKGVEVRPISVFDNIRKGVEVLGKRLRREPKATKEITP